MDIAFYNYAGHNNVIDKGLGNVVKSITGAKPFQPLSPLTGELLLEYDADVFACNYCTFLGKCYFITDKELLTGQRMRLICKTDVLTTYATDIKKIDVVCKRSATKQSQYIADQNAPVETRRRVSQQENASELAAYSPNMILLTVG